MPNAAGHKPGLVEAHLSPGAHHGTAAQALGVIGAGAAILPRASYPASIAQN
jgi:hypothetical protein